MNTCIICEQKTEEYLLVRGQIICTRCEQRILDLKINHPHYNFYKERIKRLWEPV
jgi:uncharacterized protein YlaI